MTSEEKRLLRLFGALDAEQRDLLLAFAALLESRAGGSAGAPSIPAPEAIPRPEQETVVAAIKRLTATYPMLDKSKVLHETSSLVAEHVMGGRPAGEVIDQLEATFERHYRRLVDGRS
jgi:hypothetical protein